MILTSQKTAPILIGIFLVKYNNTALNIPTNNAGIALVSKETTSYIYIYAFIGNKEADIYTRAKFGTWQEWKKH